MAAVITELEQCRKSKSGKTSRPLMVFDDRATKSQEPESIYQVAQPTSDPASPKPDVLSSVFVRSRTSSNDRPARQGGMQSRENRQLAIAMLILAIVIIVSWYMFR